VWRRLKTFYADVMLLSVDCFRKNRPEDAEIPILGPGGEFESRWIRLADLKGNIQAHPESDETFPRLKSQQRAVVQQLMASSDPMIQQALADPSNIGFVKGVLGFVGPGRAGRRFAQQAAAGDRSAAGRRASGACFSLRGLVRRRRIDTHGRGHVEPTCYSPGARRQKPQAKACATRALRPSGFTLR
jgi:hypothetical protein